MRQIAIIVEDYLNAPETPVVTLKTPRMGTRVVSKNEETHTIDEAKMKAVRMLVGSDMWVLHTGEAAVEDKQQKETIDGLEETLKLERIDHTAEVSAITSTLHETIKGLETELAARNTVIKDFKAIEQKETDRLHAEIKQLRDTIVELRSLMDGTGVITDKQAMTMINNQATTIEEKNTVLRAYRKENTEVWGKLERIGNIVKFIPKTHLIDEIIKIIQEE